MGGLLCATRHVPVNSLCAECKGDTCRFHSKPSNSGDKFLFPSESIDVPARTFSLGTIKWNVVCSEAAPSSGFAQAGIEKGVRRLVVPFCILFDNQGKVVHELERNKKNEENGVSFVLDDFDGTGNFEFAALNEMSTNVECVMFGMKSRHYEKKEGNNLVISFATNFTWFSTDEIQIYHASFLGSQILALVTISRQTNGIPEGAWKLENLSQIISPGVQKDQWLALIRSRSKIKGSPKCGFAPTNESFDGLDSVLLDDEIYRFICNADEPERVTEDTEYENRIQTMKKRKRNSRQNSDTNDSRNDPSTVIHALETEYFSWDSDFVLRSRG